MFRLDFPKVWITIFLSLNLSSTLVEAREFTVDDLLKISSLGAYGGGPADMSPAADSLAFTIERPRESLRRLHSNGRADVWVFEAGSPGAVNVTGGSIDDSSWSNPIWSPDGRMLAMVSSRSGSLRIWVWNRETGYLVETNSAAVDFAAQPLRWITLTKIVYQAKAEKPGSPFAAAYSAWPDGGEIAIYDAGPKFAPSSSTAPSLRIVDIASGSDQLVAYGVAADWWVSPSGNGVAYVSPNPDTRSMVERISDIYSYGTGSLRIVRNVGSSAKGEEQLCSKVDAQSVQWFPIQDRLLYVCREEESGKALHAIDLQAGLPIKDVFIRKITEESVGRMLPLRTGEALLELLEDAGPNRWSSWWLIDQGIFRKVYEARRPDSVVTSPDGRGALFSTEGEISFLDLRVGRVDHIQKFADVEPLALARAPVRSGLSCPMNRAALLTSEGDRDYLIDWEALRVSAVRKPNRQSQLLSLGCYSGFVAYYDDEPALTVSVSQNSKIQPILRLNESLGAISRPSAQKFYYQNADGRRLGAWLLTPAGAVPKGGFPIVVWVYPGYDVTGLSVDEALSQELKLRPSSLNLALLSGQKYAVLIPSIPLDNENKKENVLDKVIGPVDAALDHALNNFPLNGGRAFVLGHSYGGLAVYGLLAKTDRFKAGIALAGISDMTSFWGQFAPNVLEPKANSLLSMHLVESWSQLNGAPWDEVDRYVHNSPIFYAGNIRTPLLMIQGRGDYVPYQQGEEMFSALFRQDKRVRLVLIPGEGHVFETGVATRELWRQIFAWLSEHDDWPNLQ